MALTVDPMIEKMCANLEEKTGKPVSHWIDVARQSGLEKHGQIVAFLKKEHDFTHGYAGMVAQLARKDSPVHQGGDDLLSAQYAGPKEHLKPIYDKVIGIAEGFGEGLEVAPKKTYVSLRHKKQFALVQPSTRTRVDLGINLKGKASGGRLEDSGSFNAMVSHRVRLGSADDVDDEVAGWLREAFDAAG